jgi:hypothetical protein
MKMPDTGWVQQRAVEPSVAPRHHGDAGERLRDVAPEVEGEDRAGAEPE